MAYAHAAHEHADHPTGWRRYVYSTNHKDIGTMYLVLAILAAGLRALAHLDVRRRPGWSLGHGRRLDRLSAPVDHRTARTRDGFRDPGAPPRGRILHSGRDQLHHDHLQHARARHDAAQDAAL